MPGDCSAEHFTAERRKRIRKASLGTTPMRERESVLRRERMVGVTGIEPVTPAV